MFRERAWLRLNGAATMIAVFVMAMIVVAQPQPRVMHITIDGALTDDHRAGIELGLAEMSQTAQLFGASVRSSASYSRSTIGIILADLIISHSHIPVVHLTAAGEGPSEKQCEFRIQALQDHVTWEGTLTRYGASELNERFTKRFSRAMTSGAWNGWFAVKALVDTALREINAGALCAAMSRGRFDGHKGQPLSFDPDTRVLRQPLYTK